LRYLRILVAISLVLSVLYAGGAAVGLFPFNPFSGELSGKLLSNGKTLVLTSFERPMDSLLRTDSYIKLKRVRSNSSHGNYSLQATIYLKTWFYPTETPAAVVPGATPVPAVEWRPTIYYAYDSPTPLRQTDWSEFDYFKLDVLLGEDRPANSYLIAGDAKGYRYQAPTQALLGKKVNVLALDVKDMKKNYLDITKIQFVGFVFDIAGRGKPPIVYLDNLRLERSGE
jgi:hypothetical protein